MSRAGNQEPATQRTIAPRTTSMPQTSSLVNPGSAACSSSMRARASSLIGSGLSILTSANQVMGSMTTAVTVPRTIQFAKVTVTPSACSAKPMASTLTTLPTGVM